MMDPIVKLLGDWSSSINVWSIFFRLILSILFSTIVGLERTSKRHSVGLKTFMSMSIASTMVGMLEMYFVEVYNINSSIMIAASIIAIVMLSSNSILFSSKNQIKGLTTSVTFWGIGITSLCIGIGFYIIAIISFMFFALSLTAFPSIERYLKNHSSYFEIYLELNSKKNLGEFIIIIRRLGLRIDDIESNQAYLNSGISVYTVSLTVISPELKKYKTHTEIIEALSSLDYVRHIEEM